MKRKALSFEQWVTLLSIVMIAAMGVMFFLYYPGFVGLGQRTERTLESSAESYLLAKSGAIVGYKKMAYKAGRNPFLPGTSMGRIRGTRTRRVRTPRIITIKKTTPSPSRSPRVTPPPPSIVRTPPPYVVPVSLVGIVRLDDSGRKVLLRINSSGEVLTVELGGMIAGMKVMEITPVSVYLKSPKGRVYILKDPKALGE